MSRRRWIVKSQRRRATRATPVKKRAEATGSKRHAMPRIPSSTNTGLVGSDPHQRIVMDRAMTPSRHEDGDAGSGEGVEDSSRIPR